MCFYRILFAVASVFLFLTPPSLGSETSDLVRKIASSAPVFPDYTLTESGVIRLARENTPEHRRIESRKSAQEALLYQEESRYQWKLKAIGNYSETKEQPFAPQVPIFSPRKTGELSVTKYFSYGVSTKTGIETLQQSSLASGIVRSTTSRIFAQADVSLWKNLLGKLNRAQLANQKLDHARASVLHEIETHAHKIEVRKLYWSLVANARSIAVTEELLNTAERQLKEAKRRKQNSVADTAEVSRYQAQVSTRRSQLLVLQFERESTITKLRVALPQLNGKNIKLTRVDPNRAQAEVMKCVDVIVKHNSLPLENSKYDEIIGILRMKKEAAKVANNSIDDPDLKLTGKLMTTGLANSYGDSFQDFQDNDRGGFEVGLTLTVPLGGDLKRNRNAALIRDDMALSAEAEEIEAGMIAAHTAVLQNIRFLLQAVESQKDSSEALRKRLKEVRKKYKQARVSVTELVNDQDELLNSELNIIQTQIAILNSLFDYFEVFSETPCEFNQRAG